MAQFIIRRFLKLRWAPQLIMGGGKILSVVVENLHFLDSLNYLPIILKSVPKSFELTCKNGYYPPHLHHCNNLDYVRSHPEPKFYGADFMSGDERTQFSAWYEGVRDKILNNREKMLAYCMEDVNILRQASCAFRNLFLKWSRWTPFGKPLQYRPFATRYSGSCF